MPKNDILISNFNSELGEYAKTIDQLTKQPFFPYFQKKDW